MEDLITEIRMLEFKAKLLRKFDGNFQLPIKYKVCADNIQQAVHLKIELGSYKLNASFAKGLSLIPGVEWELSLEVVEP
jgi:hypothetical protein